MSIDEKEPTSKSMDSIFSGKKFDYHHLFHLVLDHSNDLIVLLDKRGQILAINQRSAKLLGGLPRNFEGKFLYDVLKDAHTEKRNQDLRNMFRTGEKIIYNRQLEFGGEKIWLETAIEPIKDSNGEVQVALILAKDITKQKKAEEALSESKAYYQALFHHAQEAIFLINDDLRIIDANPAACKITSYDRQDLLTS
ncbi:MAG: PAS domain-containing protein [Anaerolineales bacterium]